MDLFGLTPDKLALFAAAALLLAATPGPVRLRVQRLFRGGPFGAPAVWLAITPKRSSP